MVTQKKHLIEEILLRNHTIGLRWILRDILWGKELYTRPDLDILFFSMRDWASREAYLDMDRRKKAGLPLIDPYYVHPDQITLPTEGEIGDQEIVM